MSKDSLRVALVSKESLLRDLGCVSQEIAMRPLTEGLGGDLRHKSNGEVGGWGRVERWGAGVEYHFAEFNEPYAPS